MIEMPGVDLSQTDDGAPLAGRTKRHLAPARPTLLRTGKRLIKRPIKRGLRALGRPSQAGAFWLDTGRRLSAKQRYRAASRALITAAERGALLDLVAYNILDHPPLRRAADHPDFAARMLRLAATDPSVPERQFGVGAFFLDQGDLERGRALVERGHRLVLERNGGPGAWASAEPHRGPDFLMIGPAKTGSTSLYAFITHHPHVMPSARKELLFWGHRYGRSLETYEAYFPSRLPPGHLTGEASTDFLTQPSVASTLASHYPALKAIALHRDPVGRAYSDFQMHRRHHTEHRRFSRVVEDELRVLGTNPPIEQHEVGWLEAHGSMLLMRSCMLPYLRLWVDAFGAERVMVVSTAELSADRQSTVDAVFDFLGLPPASVEEPLDINVHAYEPISDDLRARLTDWFAPHEAALRRYLEENPKLVRHGIA